MSSIFLKRINKELQDFNEEKYFYRYPDKTVDFFRKLNIEIYCSSESNNDKYYIRVYKNNCNIIILSIPNNYPFKPYQILNFNDKTFHIYGNNIHSLTRFKNIEKLRFFYRLLYNNLPKFLSSKYDSCYCCNSVTCSNNWSPSCKIDNILMEYLEMEFIKHYCQDDNYKKLLSTYDHLFNLLFEKIPNEVIEIILNYCFE
jgi:ubiquitin-protein ligase